MIVTRTTMMAAIFGLLFATPALAATSQIDSQNPTAAPCDEEGAFDGALESAAFRPGDSYFPEEPQAAPDAKAAPDADEDNDSADDGDEDKSDDQGCAEIMVAPYDFMVHPLEATPEWATLRRRRPVAWVTKRT